MLHRQCSTVTLPTCPAGDCFALRSPSQDSACKCGSLAAHHLHAPHVVAAHCLLSCAPSSCRCLVCTPLYTCYTGLPTRYSGLVHSRVLNADHWCSIWCIRCLQQCGLLASCAQLHTFVCFQHCLHHKLLFSFTLCWESPGILSYPAPLHYFVHNFRFSNTMPQNCAPSAASTYCQAMNAEKCSRTTNVGTALCP